MTIVKAAAVQLSPVLYSREGTVDKVVQKVLDAQVGTVTRLMTKDRPDVAGKEGMIEIVDFAPGEASQPHRHNA
jgi:quercetin dioxygenase-like cupin family protein